MCFHISSSLSVTTDKPPPVDLIRQRTEITGVVGQQGFVGRRVVLENYDRTRWESKVGDRAFGSEGRVISGIWGTFPCGLHDCDVRQIDGQYGGSAARQLL